MMIDEYDTLEYAMSDRSMTRKGFARHKQAASHRPIPTKPVHQGTVFQVERELLAAYGRLICDHPDQTFEIRCLARVILQLRAEVAALRPLHPPGR
jgi:hypothetical protein